MLEPGQTGKKINQPIKVVKILGEEPGKKEVLSKWRDRVSYRE